MTRDERGQVTVLIVGFAIVLMMMVGVVVDASAAYLRRQELDTLADGAALAGAEGVRGAAVYDGGLGETAPIDAEDARREIDDYFARIGAYDDHPGLDFRVTVTADKVVVHVRTPLDLPITVAGLTATSVSAVGASSVLVRG